MKYFIISICLLGMIACIKSSRNINSIPVKVKLLRVTCATVVIDILDEKYDSLGEPWSINHDSTITALHATQVLNKCEFPENLKPDDTFTIGMISAADANNNCAVCALYDYPPSKGIYGIVK